MASAETVDAVEVEVRIAARPETIFDFFTEPDRMIQWMGRSCELDPRAGGVFRCDMHGELVVAGEYIAVEPPGRLVLSWGWEGEGALTPPGSSRVEVLLEPAGEETTVRLIHTDLPTAEAAEKHSHGWNYYLDRLAVTATGGDPGPDKFAA